MCGITKGLFKSHCHQNVWFYCWLDSEIQLHKQQFQSTINVRNTMPHTHDMDAALINTKLTSTAMRVFSLCKPAISGICEAHGTNMYSQCCLVFHVPPEPAPSNIRSALNSV